MEVKAIIIVILVAFIIGGMVFLRIRNMNKK